MKSIINIVVACTIMIAAVSQASVALMEDDFGSSTVSAQSRFTDSDINGDWIMRNGGEASWSISGGELTNSGANDPGAFLLNTVTSGDTSLTHITVSFDYSVGTGSTLYYHSSLFTGSLTDSGNISRISDIEGRYFATSGSNDFYGNFAGDNFNLADGAAPTGLTGDALASFAGNTTGTFNQTYDITGFTGVANIADISHILAVFTADTAATGLGAISIDNFNVTAVPEPSAFVFVGLGVVGSLFLRLRIS